MFYKENNFNDTELGEIPNGWKVVKLSDVGRINRGASPRPINDPRYFSNDGRGWVRIGDVTKASKYLKETSQYLSEIGASKSVMVSPGDLIMSICATIGKPIILDMEACIHDGFVIFRDLSKEVDTEFLFYVLQKNEGNFSNMRQTGTQGNLNTTLVGGTKIALPPLSEQREIVKILSNIDETIQKTNELITET